MDFTLSDEQQLLREGLGKFLSTRYGLESSRAAAKLGPGWQPEIWRAFAEDLGILGAALPERVGGIGGGPTEIMVIAEALGHALVIEPYVDTVVVAGGLLQRAHSPVADALLEKIATGEAVVALAAAEAQSGDRWQDVATTARADGEAWALDGAKIAVPNAPLATHLMVTANTPAGLSLFLIDVADAAPGLTLHGYRTVDDRRAADVELSGVRAVLLGTEGAAWESISRARDEGAAAVAAEAVGNMRKVLADTVEYCKQRQQFGTPIGAFQALQHRMVDMYVTTEQSRSMACLACSKADTATDARERAQAISAAKIKIADAARLVSQESIQLHGGMGMTEEMKVSHTFRRLTMIAQQFGDADHHLGRFAGA